MLRVTSGGDAQQLAASLAQVLADPMPDPMAPEWIVVTTAGVQRWLGLELARRLGTSGPDRSDGVAANLDMLFPGTLARRVLAPDTDTANDPWHLDRVAWVVLDVLESAATATDPRLGPLNRLAPGATRWGRARRLADLFDRYLLHRPSMLARWAAGHDVDGAGMPLPDRSAWQPHLWRLVHARIGVPSPAERHAERLTEIRAGDCPADIPARVSLFGLSTLPGGAPFLELLEALGTQRDVHLLAHQPSPAMTRAVVASASTSQHRALHRSEDQTGDLVSHPLLLSWARPARESMVLLADHLTEIIGHEAAAEAEPTTLLERIQRDIQTDTAPASDFSPDPADRSIQIHTCHGNTRQVEVLRDQILHLLADDPTLTEDDIVVFCPALDEFAPLIESVLGPPAGSGGRSDEAPLPGAPTLSYRLTDRSLRATYPLLGALGALVELLDSRFSDAAVLDFANLGPVRERFGLDDDNLTTLADWVDKANTRWGLDGAHRERWGIPASYEAGSWRSAIDRLLLGITISDDPDSLAVGQILPIGVEGSNTAVAGRLADLLARLANLADVVQGTRPAQEWLRLLQDAAATLFAVDPDLAWQQTRLANVLEDLAAQAVIGAENCGVDLALADIRHLLGSHLQGTAGRADFFRGGVTVSSLTPLRGIPYRVVCLLGMDESAFAAGSPNGDDLTSADPRLGDRDRRSDARQSLLETVLAAQENLVVIRTGHSVVTNQPVPAAVVVAELVDVLTNTIDPVVRQSTISQLTIAHPRQSFDQRNFATVGSPTVGAGLTGPWSFDPLARAGAAARLSPGKARPFLAAPLADTTSAVIALADLREFLVHPPQWFLRSILEIRLPDNPSRNTGKLVAPTIGASGVPRAAEGRDLVLTLEGLDKWKLRDRFLTHRRSGGDAQSFLRRERAAELLPPGRLAEDELSEAEGLIDALMGALDELGAVEPSTEHRAVDFTLPDGTRLIGTVADHAGNHLGPVTASVSKTHDKQRRVPWLDLMALTANDPDPHWTSVLLTQPRSPTAKGFQKRVLEIPIAEADRRHERAVAALTLVVDLFRRGSCEPLPIFPNLSPALFKGKSTSSAWNSDSYSTGDSADEWIQVAFNHATVEHITSLPIEPGDPDGSGSDRARRYAHHLWGAMESSLASDDETAS
jgi:exodeoxyribonuclease V gamma subunit